MSDFEIVILALIILPSVAWYFYTMGYEEGIKKAVDPEIEKSEREG